jgi:hypothetical protein
MTVNRRTAPRHISANDFQTWTGVNTDYGELTIGPMWD